MLTRPGRRSSSLLVIATAAVLGGFVLFAACGASAQGSDRRASVRRPVIAGAFVDSAGGQGTFSGTLALGRFQIEQGFLVVLGTLTGTLADSTGTIVGRVNEPIVVPVSVTRASCALLQLDVAPVDLDLLGREVHIDGNALGITAADGPPRTLGALLCSTARLVASRSTPEGLATNLNSVLAAIPPPR